MRDLFQREDTGLPYFEVAWELGQIRDQNAIPELIQIAGTVRDTDARRYSLEALANMRAAEALPAIAGQLTDPDEYVRISALGAMSAITGEQSCALPADGNWTGATIEPIVSKCLAWWNSAGILP